MNSSIMTVILAVKIVSDKQILVHDSFVVRNINMMVNCPDKSPNNNKILAVVCRCVL